MMNFANENLMVQKWILLIFSWDRIICQMQFLTAICDKS